jgi:hypothetical protein
MEDDLKDERNMAVLRIACDKGADERSLAVVPATSQKFSNP